MRLFPAIAVTVLAGLALVGMRWSTPSYDVLTGPLYKHGAAGETVSAREFEARAEPPRFARRIAYTRFSKRTERDTSGVWAIVPLEIKATSETMTLMGVAWRGASGRLYAQTPRLGGAGLISDSTLQPGLRREGIALFEIPPDEAPGGALVLSRMSEPRLDSRLVIEMPENLDPSKAVDVWEIKPGG